MECVFPCLYPDDTPLYALHDNLPVGTPRQPPVQRVTAEDRGGPIFAEFVNVLCRGMQGSVKTPPDVAMDWILNEPDRRGQHATPLKEDPSDLRKRLFNFSMNWACMHAADHGGLFCVRDPESFEMVAAAVCFPPSEDKNYHVGMCKFVRMVWDTMIRHKQFPKEVDSRRKDLLHDTMHELHDAHCPNRHWYCMHVAVLPNHQRKGYGRKLMEFVAQLADADAAPVFVEVVGERNEAFFKELGYAVLDRRVPTLTTPPVGNNAELNENGGVMAMLRMPII